MSWDTHDHMDEYRPANGDPPTRAPSLSEMQALADKRNAERQEREDQWLREYSAVLDADAVPVAPVEEAALGCLAPVIELSAEQQQAYQQIKDWLTSLPPEAWSGVEHEVMPENPHMFVLTGFAGSGKTTVLRYLYENLANDLPELGLGSIAFCAFTGKAASVLRRKGVEEARTIHSTIYSYNRQTRSFSRKAKLFNNAFVVDEASTVSRQLFEDLSLYNIPALYVGDPGQLEPVGDDVALTARSNFHLNEIHRQAQESPIIQFSMVIRGKQEFGFGETAGLKIIPNKKMNIELLGQFIGPDSQIICGLNTTRQQVNIGVRAQVLKFPDDEPLVVGDKIICLRNDRESGVSNGETGVVLSAEATANGIKCDIQFDGYPIPHKGLTVHRPTLMEGKVHNEFYDWARRAGNMGNHPIALTYGYAITAHKSQGSEWARVAVIDEGTAGKWDPARWRYVAVTRAKQELVFASHCRW